MSSNNYCIIMAGGISKRFWPKSRKSMPKQFLDIFGTGRSLLQQTFDRFSPIVEIENFIIITNRRYAALVREQLPQIEAHQILCEPIGRNTAPSICYAAYTLLESDPEANMIVTPCDLTIDNEERFRNVIEECVEFIQTHNALLTIGIKPTRPDSNYGYIQVVDPDKISRARCFIEKPATEMAQTFLECGEFFWNSGMFIWKVRDIISAVEQHLPEHAAQFRALTSKFGTPEEGEELSRLFSECRAISIDYGVMERADNVYVRTAEFGWSDIGTWSSLHQNRPKDSNGNSEQKGVMKYNTHNTIISLPAGKVAVVSGLDDYIVIDTPDVLMICPRNDEKQIKNYIHDVSYSEGDDYI